MPDNITLSLLIFVAAVLYSSVGHAGASGYLAVMALLNMAPESMKPTALILNVLVATIGTIQFVRAGHFSWSFFWPFALGSVPFAFFGGWLKIDDDIYKKIVGVILILSAIRMAISLRAKSEEIRAEINPAWRVASGVLIGFLAGLTGTGGGIFLSPLILLLRWADAKRTAATSVLFILFNSIAGLAGNITQVKGIPDNIAYLLIAAGLGGFTGSWMGSKKLDNRGIKILLAAVLIVAGIKLVLLQTAKH